MPRFSVSLDDEENEWIEQLADEHNHSKSHVVASIVEAARAEGFDLFADTAPVGTTADRLDDLEARVAALEDDRREADAPPPDVDEMHERGREAPDASAGSGAPPDGATEADPDDQLRSAPEGPAVSGDLDAGLLAALEEHLADRPPHKAHGKRAALATVLALRERAPGAVATGELQQAVYETGDLAEHYTDARTLWNSISRYFDDIPGVEKAGYGEWRYTGDDAVREALREE